MGKQILAWSAHFYTGLGLVAAAGIVIAIFEGTAESFRLAFFLMLVATIIDATDGTLARLVKVKEVLPGFDGRRLDDLIDFQTFTTLPLLLIWRADLVPKELEGWLLLPLLASAYGFCQVEAKTDDGYFLGFPSYWNIIAFYVYVLRPPQWITLGLLILFAVLTFVPSRYLYPTQRGKLNLWTNALGVVWCGFLLWIVARLGGEEIDQQTWWVTIVSLFFPIYYLVASWIITIKIAMTERE